VSAFNRVLNTLKDNKQKRLKGDKIAIPWSLPRLSTVLPGIEKARYNLVSASPKAGKTMLADFLYVYQPIEWKIANPDSNIIPKIFYFSLEVSINSKIKAAMCYKLFKDYNVVISPQKLGSVFGGYILDDQVEEIISSVEFQEWFYKFESMVTFYDSIRNPYGIYKVIKDYAEHPDVGYYEKKLIDWQNKDGTYTKKEVKGQYIARNPDEYVIVIVDHISLLQPEKDKTLHQSIGQFSSEFCLQMRDKWSYIPVIVQQQSADSSRAQYNYKGDTVLEKIKPDQEGLADNKYTARDVDLMISLFNPTRYNLEKYNGLDLTQIGDNHREFVINLNRNGESNAAIQLFFLGQSSFFSELPKALGPEDYGYIKNLINKSK